MYKYMAGVFEYDNDWIDNSVLDSLVGKTFFTRFLDTMVEAVISRIDNQVIVQFELDRELPSDEFYLDIAAACQYDPNTGRVLEIEYIEEMFPVQHFANKDILMLRVA